MAKEEDAIWLKLGTCAGAKVRKSVIMISLFKRAEDDASDLEDHFFEVPSKVWGEGGALAICAGQAMRIELAQLRAEARPAFLSRAAAERCPCAFQNQKFRKQVTGR